MNKKNTFTTVILFIILIAIIIYLAIFKKEQTYEPDYAPDYKIKYQYKDNEYKIIRIEDGDIVKKYYENYLNMFLNNQEELYNNLTDKLKEKYKNIKNFKKICKKKTTTKTKKNKVVKYYVDRRKDYNYIKVIDSEEREIIFYEYGVNKYEIELSY